MLQFLQHKWELSYGNTNNVGWFHLGHIVVSSDHRITNKIMTSPRSNERYYVSSDVGEDTIGENLKGSDTCKTAEMSYRRLDGTVRLLCKAVILALRNVIGQICALLSGQALSAECPH